jgi:hypothetical protein
MTHDSLFCSPSILSYLDLKWECGSRPTRSWWFNDDDNDDCDDDDDDNDDDDDDDNDDDDNMIATATVAAMVEVTVVGVVMIK